MLPELFTVGVLDVDAKKFYTLESGTLELSATS